MPSTNLLKTLLGPLIVLSVFSLGWLTRDTWKDWLLPDKADLNDDAKAPPASGPEKVKISAQAQRNLRLVVKEATTTTYWRKIYLPGTVIDKPGHSDRGIPAPIAGRITLVNAVPGKTVRAGEQLFRLRIVSEPFQASQMELFKSTRELEITKKERKRLEAIGTIAIPTTKLLELQYQEDRLNALIHAHRQDLQVKQLTKAQIADIEKGQFVTEVVIQMPKRDSHGNTDSPGAPPVEYEVQELKVHLGEHVQMGQILVYVADHRKLYIEGRALKQEAKLLAQAAKEGWPVEAEFTEDEVDSAGERVSDLTIEFLGSTMDASGLTLPIYVPFDNPLREYKIRDKIYRTGQYRPGQRVLLKVSVSKVPDVFVLPIDAVVREGAEAYIFCQNGDAFERRPVHILYEDFDQIVLANDSSIITGIHFIAQNGAAALNRALKASQGDGGGGGHHHHH